MAEVDPMLTEILERMNRTNDEILRSIDASLNEIATHGMELSQNTLDDLINGADSRSRRRAPSASNLPGRMNRDEDADRHAIDRRRNRDRLRDDFRDTNLRDVIADFEDELSNQLSTALLGAPMSGIVSEALGDFATSLGMDVKDLGQGLGQLAGDVLGDAIKSTKFGKDLNTASLAVKDVMSTTLTDVFSGLQAGDLTAVGQAFANLGPAVAGLAPVIAPLIPPILAVTAALWVFDKITEGLQKSWKEVIESADAFKQSISAAANKTKEMAKFNLASSMERIEADVKSMVEASYDIMENATKEMLQSWDSSLKVITASQGYTKSDLQDLISNYAQRLRSEGLSSVVSAADLTTNLSKVLESGLSGRVAEEFAYIATKLGAAIPTEDFFSYASTYASLAANAITSGASQAQAIEYANAQLEQFASNLLYSSRELAGGFSTGLQNASSILESATQIALSSRTGNAAEISGVLTAVSAAVGAVAPDLASGLVQNVVDAALGGNAETVTALRSLSGVGASNTAFLNALATDAQAVFTNLFNNLAGLQKMSADNYMEVAEGLSSIFGVSQEAFARVDFNYLASVISSMQINDKALNENMSLLVDGQTTSTAEQLKMAEINQIMIDEGLSYVLDNEVARSIQENMWAEQRKRDIQETTFGVEMQGKGLEFLQSIANLVSNVLNILHPFKTIANKIDSIAAVAAETAQQERDISRILEAGKVGSGNSLERYNLTTRRTDLNLVPDYVDRLVEKSTRLSDRFLDYVAKGPGFFNYASAGSLVESAEKLREAATSITQSALRSRDAGTSSHAVSSRYSWGTIGKSALAGGGVLDMSSAYALPEVSGQAAVISTAQKNVQNYLNTMQAAVEKGQSYEEWEKTAKKYGIQDLNESLSEFGLTAQDVADKYRDMETYQAAQEIAERDEFERHFWEDAVQWYEETYPVNWEDFNQTWTDRDTHFHEVWTQRDDAWTARFEEMKDLAQMYAERWKAYNDDWHIELSEHYNTVIEPTWQKRHDELTKTISDWSFNILNELKTSNRKVAEFYNQWVDYYVNHTAYSRETLNAYDVAAIRNAERAESGDAVLALAEALTSNAVDLKDPAVQTNVLLSKILLVAEAIMQQNNDTSTVSLPTALASLGLGITTENL